LFYRLFVLLIGGAQLLALGIIGEYIARIHGEVRARPVYVVAGELNGERGRRSLTSRVRNGEDDIAGPLSLLCGAWPVLAQRW